VAALDVGHDGHVGVRHQPAGQLAQGAVGDIDASRCQERRELQQVAAHRGGELRGLDRQLRPLPVRLGTRDPGLDGLLGYRSPVDLLDGTQLGRRVGVDQLGARRYSAGASRR
jgi:hypothetical protein